MNELQTLHEAITATIKSAMPQLQIVDAYAMAAQDTALPALFHSIAGLKPGVDPGDGRSCIVAIIDARILVDASLAQASLQAATLATQLTVLLRKQFWDLDFVEEAKNVQGLPVQAAPGALHPVSWVVQWEQTLHLGDPQWPWPDEPGPIAFAFSPDTGPGHEGGYQTPEELS